MAAGGGGEAEGIMAAGGQGIRELDAATSPDGDDRKCEAAADPIEPRKELPDTTASCAQAASSCSMAIHGDRFSGKTAQQHGEYYYKRRRFSKDKTAMSGGIAVSSNKGTPNSADLSCQLEARAYRLLKDAGWSITPRIRKDRPKMAFYFAAPDREVVVTSLAQAWKFCGQMLHTASAVSEQGKFAREWSDVHQFWKDLVITMDYAGKMTMDVQSSHTLLQRWQFLDPFVAVVFIDKRITALQKQKTLVAVDSSTCLVDDVSNRASGATCNGCQNVQCCHHLSSTQETHVKPELCGTQDVDSEMASPTENHFQSKSEPGKINCGETIGRNLVKRVRKKSRWLSDFESTGLTGLYARSFTQPTIGSNESGICSTDSRMSKKKHVKAKNEPAKLIREKIDLSLCSAHQRINYTRGAGRTDGLARLSEINYAVTESRTTEIITDNRQQSKTPNMSSVRGLSEDLVTVSNGSNIVAEAELCHTCNSATVVECNTSPEAQSQEKSAIKSNSESWGKGAKKGPSVMYNDDDLLITVIVKSRDMGSFHRSTSQSLSSKGNFRMLKSSKKGNRLLIQTARKGGTDVLDGRQIILARKTVLCWLIATGFMTLKDVVECRNAKNNDVLKDGWVTWDGILCSCCIKTLSVSDFKAHVDSSLPKSSLNLSLQSGKSLTLCQLEAWTSECMYRQSNDRNRNVKAEAIDENDDTCGICGDGGQLLCCDNCPSTYHQACLSTEVSIFSNVSPYGTDVLKVFVREITYIVLCLFHAGATR